MRRYGATQARQNIQGEASARDAIGTGTHAHLARAKEPEERLDLAHDLPAGAIGIKDLVKKAKEGTANRIDLFPAVGSVIGLRQEQGRQKRAE